MQTNPDRPSTKLFKTKLLKTTPRPLRGHAESVPSLARTDSYGATAEVPVGSYAVLMATYAAVFASLMFISTRNGRALAKPKGLDLTLLTIASYKLARVITMSFIASPLRAPFTHRGHSLYAGEVQDQARGEGLQRAVGNLLTCPFCFSVWATTAFLFGYTLVPKATMQAAYILSIAAVDDFLHLEFRNLREASV